MLAKIEGREISTQKEINETHNVDYSFVGLTDRESEINWVKLHQMFDK